MGMKRTPNESDGRGGTLDPDACLRSTRETFGSSEPSSDSFSLWTGEDGKEMLCIASEFPISLLDLIFAKDNVDQCLSLQSYPSTFQQRKTRKIRLIVKKVQSPASAISRDFWTTKSNLAFFNCGMHWKQRLLETIWIPGLTLSQEKVDTTSKQ